VPEHGYGASASRGVPVYVPAFAGIQCAYSRMDGQAELTWVAIVTCQDGLTAWRRSPIQVLTGSGVEWLRWCDQRRYQLSQTATASHLFCFLSLARLTYYDSVQTSTLLIRERRRTYALVNSMSMYWMGMSLRVGDKPAHGDHELQVQL